MKNVALKNPRINSIDALRGIIMVIMVLDHARDYFTIIKFDPTDLTQSDPLLFFTRWITHFCAPTFVLLSGTSAYLSLSAYTDKSAASLFLLKRGLWLLLLEITVIGFGWTFDVQVHTFFFQVIWTIGWCMIALSGLIFLRTGAIALIGLFIIVFHNLLDPLSASDFGVAAPLWMLLHQPGQLQLGAERSIQVIYPILPWIGVIALGYAMGSVFGLRPDRRKRTLIILGALSLLCFVILRLINTYGDPNLFIAQHTPAKSVMAFVNCSKYPPSLLYLLMTLGCSVLALAFLETANPFTAVMRIFGKVPMFYYILHIYLLHVFQLIIAFFQGYSYSDMSHFRFGGSEPAGWGFDLPFIYLIWMLVVVALYLPCKWYAGQKASNKKWWHSYL